MSGFGFTIRQDTNHLLNRKYNVEYMLGNGKIMTFSNTLVHADGEYFCFESKENGLDIIRQDNLISITCLDRFTKSQKEDIKNED
jgi:hypothetical protein